MQVTARFSGELVNQIGVARLSVTLPDDATVTDLVQHLSTQHPAAAARLATAVPVIAGRHVSGTEPLANGQEVALILPIAGG